MVNRYIFIVLLTLLGSVTADARIVASNLTGEKLHLSFHGEGCRQFVSAEYSYPACTERDLKVNETAVFTNILDPRGLTNKEKLLRPRISFNRFGFAYSCRVRETALSRVCVWSEAWFVLPSKHLQTPLEPMSYENSDQMGVLSVDNHYLLEILAGWTLIPTPQMDCKVTQVIEDATLCNANASPTL